MTESTQKRSQYQLAELSRKNLAECNLQFMEMKHDMTAGELRTLIAKRPEVWGRYANWLEVLPELGH